MECQKFPRQVNIYFWMWKTLLLAGLAHSQCQFHYKSFFSKFFLFYFVEHVRYWRINLQNFTCVLLELLNIMLHFALDQWILHFFDKRKSNWMAFSTKIPTQAMRSLIKYLCYLEIPKFAFLKAAESLSGVLFLPFSILIPTYLYLA